MQISKTNNVIFLKNLESNLIEEAFVILKDNIKLNKTDEVSKNVTCSNILKEAELLINQKIEQNKLQYEKFKVNKLERKIKFLKIINIISIITLILSILVR